MGHPAVYQSTFNLTKERMLTFRRIRFTCAALFLRCHGYIPHIRLFLRMDEQITCVAFSSFIPKNFINTSTTKSMGVIVVREHHPNRAGRFRAGFSGAY